MEKENQGISLIVKLLVLVIGISMLITTVMGVLFYARTGYTLKQNYRNTVTENLWVRAEQFDSVMKNAYLTCVYAATDEKVQGLVRKDDTYEELIEELRDYCSKNEEIHSIYCYVKASDVLVQASKEDAQVQEGSFQNHAWEAAVLEGESGTPFSPVYNRDSTSVIQRNFFSYGKKIYDRDGRELGILFVNVDERSIFFSCLQTNGNSLGSLSVTRDDKIVSADRVSQIGKKVVESDSTILVKVPTAQTGYSLCSLSRASVLEDSLRKSRNWIILVAFLLNLIMAGPMYLILRGMLQPMKKLEESMNHVKDGNLSVRAKIYRNDEIGSLSANFNDMLEQLETLIDELVTQKMLKKEAELEALSYQITPHFMYNTLASIRYAAILDGYQEIGELLQAFTELLRLSASDRGAFITVQQEVRMVHNYIRLQQFRYKDTFQAELKIVSGTELFYVPRLLIQPLVENAILHGLDHRDVGNMIRVTVCRKESDLEIRVEDNGSGMTEEEIHTLLSGGYHSKFSGIGINNIIERLHLYYGDRGKLEYICPAEGGTIALITLPASDDADEYVI